MLKSKKIIIGILVILLIALSVNPVYAANSDSEKGKPFSFTANEEQLQIINNLKGTTITQAEFLRRIHPEALEYLPDEILNILEKDYVDWDGQGSYSNDFIMNTKIMKAQL